MQVPQWFERLGSLAIANNAVDDYKATITNDLRVTDPFPFHSFYTKAKDIHLFSLCSVSTLFHIIILDFLI